MSAHASSSWGWGPRLLLVDRFHATDPELVPVPVERAPAVLEALLRDDATALHRLAVALGWLEPEHAWRHEARALARRVLDELERPSGRLLLLEQPRDESLGQLDDTPDPEDVVDLVDLADADTHWIEFRLHDQNDEPFAGLEYELRHPDGRQTTGRLNEHGIARLDEIPAGDYTIRFPAAELVVLGEDGPGTALVRYGVTRLELRGAGGARSTGWTANDDPPPDDAAPDFWLAPVAETVTIAYTIEDPEGRAEEAVLELFVLDDDGDEVVLWRRPLTADEHSAGDHELPWDGTVDPSSALPEGFVTVLRSPYTLRLRLRGHGQADPPAAQTRLWVDVAAIELELGDRAVLGRDLDRAVYDALGGALPAAGATTPVMLVSNVFKTSSAEMNDDSLFREYQALWGHGPRIPVFATVKVKASDGSAVVAPRALAGLPFAWEWIDVAEDTSAHHAAAKTFLDAALDFDKDLTEPAGDNCHVDRGGKRGPGAEPVFPEQAGHAPAAAFTAGSFPFRVERAVERPSVARSYAWTDGVAAGKTGVLFEPSRMAGDAWSLRVLPFGDLREDGPAPGAVQASTGTFETWREVHVVKYLKKKATIADVSIPVFQAYYAAAKVKMEDQSGGSQAMAAADYNARVAAAVAAQPFFVQAAVDPAVDQHATGDHALSFRSYAAFQAALRASQGWNAAQLAAWLAGGGAAVNTASKYHGRCKTWATTLTVAACNGYVHANAGVNVLHFSGLYNLEAQPGGRQLNGFAPSFASTGRTKCAFVLCPGPGNYGGGNNNAQQTLTHEIGHHMFLPHAPFPAGSPPAGAQATRHDGGYANCTMSYDYSAERKFCGLCILRMRGFSADWLVPQADENTRP
jgi:hypothetical protein